MLPKSLRTPLAHLLHLALLNFAFPIGSPLLVGSINLATLSLDWISLSAYFPSNDLIQRLAQMPQLETLSISFHSPVPTVTSRENYCVDHSRHTSFFRTFVAFGPKVLALTWKRFFLA